MLTFYFVPKVCAHSYTCRQWYINIVIIIHMPQQECGERQAQCERALRDKRAVEKELEKLSRYSPQESTQRGNVLHELQSRVCASDRARDDAVMKLDTALTTIKRLEAK